MARPNRKNARDLNRTRQNILDAAAKEFAEHGLSGARVDRIAARARVNKAMIYYIFRGKENLHLAVLESLFEEKTKNLDSYILKPNPSREDFFVMLNSYFDAFLERRDYARILLNDIVTGGKTLRRFHRKRPDLFKVFEQISNAINEAVARGVLKEIDADKGVIVIFLLMAALACASTLADLVRPKGSAEFKNLSDPEKWRIFLAQVLQRAAFV